jgi:hypothetical protein
MIDPTGQVAYIDPTAYAALLQQVWFYKVFRQYDINFKNNPDLIFKSWGPITKT